MRRSTWGNTCFTCRRCTAQPCMQPDTRLVLAMIYSHVIANPRARRITVPVCAIRINMSMNSEQSPTSFPPNDQEKPCPRISTSPTACNAPLQALPRRTRIKQCTETRQVSIDVILRSNRELNAVDNEKNTHPEASSRHQVGNTDDSPKDMQ